MQIYETHYLDFYRQHKKYFCNKYADVVSQV